MFKKVTCNRNTLSFTDRENDFVKTADLLAFYCVSVH